MIGNVASPRYIIRTTGTTFETPGYYHSPKSLATTLNGDKPGRVKFSYEAATLYGDLPVILEFGTLSGDSSASLASSARSMFVRASSIVDLRRGFESLYVCSIIVEPRIVRDNIAPLLRVVPKTSSHGEMVTTRFDHVQYIPVLSLEFGGVETEIRDDTSRPAPFERGKVTVTLHFRRCRSGLFR